MRTLIVLLFLLAVSPLIEGLCAQPKDQAVYSVVQDVVDCNILKLKNKQEVRLSGIVCVASKRTRSQSIEFLRSLSKGHKVRVEEDGRKDDEGRPLARVYLLGEPSNKVEKDFLAYEIFIDEDLGFLKGRGKASLISINATMIKSGYALPLTKSQ